MKSVLKYQKMEKGDTIKILEKIKVRRK